MRAAPEPPASELLGPPVRGVPRTSSVPLAPTPLPDDAPPRYYLLGRRVGVPNRRGWARTVWVLGVWLGAPLLLARALGRLGRRRRLHQVARWWARGLARQLDVRLELRGLELIMPGEQYIVVALHEGLADPLALLHLPLDLRFVARDELFGWPVFGPVLRDTGQLEIRPERGSAALLQLLRDARAALAAGESVAVFPQGSILGIEIACQPGPFALARASRCPILPVVLTGSHRVWEHPFSPRLRYGQRISLRVLPPIPAAEVQAADARILCAEVERRLKQVALGGEVAPPRRYVPARDGYWDGYAFRIDPSFSSLAAEVAAHRAGRRLGPGVRSRA